MNPSFYSKIPRTTALSCSLGDLSAAFFRVLMQKPLPPGAVIWDQNSVAALGNHLVYYLAASGPDQYCDTTFLGEKRMSFDDMLEYLDMVFHLRGRQEMQSEIDVVMRRMTAALAQNDYPRKEFLERTEGEEMICGGTVYVMPRSERHSADSAKILWRFSPSWLEKLGNPEEKLDSILYPASLYELLPRIPVNLLFDANPKRSQVPANICTFLFTEAKRHIGKAFDFDASREIRNVTDNCPCSVVETLMERLSWFLKAPLASSETKSAMLDRAIAFSSAMARRKETAPKENARPFMGGML